MGEDKRSNEGYEIMESCTVGSTEFVIGHHLTAANPYVCWHCKNGTDYFWGYYTNELSLAQDKMRERYEDAASHQPDSKQKSSKNHDELER